MQEQIEAYLAKQIVRDDAKGGDGWRTTSEVAEACGLSVTGTRLQLQSLFYLEKVEQSELSGKSVWKSCEELEHARGRFPAYIP